MNVLRLWKYELKLMLGDAENYHVPRLTELILRKWLD